MRGSAKLVGIETASDLALHRPAPHFIPLVVDGTTTYVDFWNFSQLSGYSSELPPYFKLQYNAAHEPYPNVMPLMPPSFPEWYVFFRLQEEPPFGSDNDIICYRDRGMCFVPRRRKAYRLLAASRFRNRIRVKCWIDNEYKYMLDAMRSMVTLHVPGMWSHMMEWSHCQLFSCGVCVLTQELWTTCISVRPRAWEHYVPLADDLNDLIDQVSWCEDHRRECREIGQNAKQFWMDYLSPKTLWRHIFVELQGGY